jgi:DNA primase
VVEREVLKLAVQRPALAGPVFDALDDECFAAPAYAAVRSAVRGAGGAASSVAGAGWVERVRAAAETDSVRDLVTELAVEPMQTTDEDDPRYAASLLARLQEMTLTRRIADLKSQVQRVNPVERPEEYNRLFGELIVLERNKIGLRERALGAL